MEKFTTHLEKKAWIPGLISRQEHRSIAVFVILHEADEIKLPDGVMNDSLSAP